MTHDIQSSSIMDTRKKLMNAIYPVLFTEICSLKKPILMGHPVCKKCWKIITKVTINIFYS